MIGRQPRQRRLGPWLESQALRAGSLALLGLLALGMGSQRAWWTRHTPVSLEVASAAGLSAGMGVRVSGFPIGRVEQISLLPNARVRVNLSLMADKLPLIGPASRASLAQDNLLSPAYIAISPDPAGAAARRPGTPPPRLRFEASADLMDLITDLAQSRLTFEQMLRHTSSLMEHRLPHSLDALDRTLGSGSTLADTLRQEVMRGSASLQGRVETTGSQVSQTLTQLQSTLVDVQALVRDSNNLMRDIRHSGLMQLLEPATPKPEAGPPDARDPAGR